MLNILKRREKLYFSILFLLLGIFTITLGQGPVIIGNVIITSGDPLSIPYLSLILLFGGTFLLISQGKPLEAILVPTGPAGKIDEQRALAGAKLYQQNPGSLVIISGALSGKFLGSQSDHIYRTLRRAGVPRGQIEIERKSKDTLENVRYTCKILNREGIQAVYVATDKDHARRIGMLFQEAKDEGLIPEGLKVKTHSRGIDKAYSSAKAQIAYVKDYLRSVKSGRLKGL